VDGLAERSFGLRVPIGAPQAALAPIFDLRAAAWMRRGVHLWRCASPGFPLSARSVLS